MGTPGVFVTIEGVDFSGKSTLVANLRRLFDGADEPVYFTREPGGTPAGERIRKVLLDPDLEMQPVTEAYLYAAARAEHVRSELLPRLRAGETVLCERFLDSSLAYQGGGRELGTEFVRRMNGFALRTPEGELLPDLTFYLRLSPAERERRAAARGALDRLEGSGAEFMAKVEASFEELVAAEPDRCRVLDATRPPEELSAAVFAEVRARRSPAVDA